MTLPEIPNRALFKASEVCELTKVQPYVLRSWEQEFPDLGHMRPGAIARVYKRGDLLRVFRIRQLVFDEGLTLSGARRKILEESGELDGDGDLPLEPEPERAPKVDARRAREVRARLAQVRTGLQSVLELLDRAAPSNGGSNNGRVQKARNTSARSAKKPKRRAVTRRRSK